MQNHCRGQRGSLEEDGLASVHIERAAMSLTGRLTAQRALPIVKLDERAPVRRYGLGGVGPRAGRVGEVVGKSENTRRDGGEGRVSSDG